MVRASQFAVVRRSQRRGFTLIELMIVISIILILVSIAVPMYQQSIIRAKEAVLRQDLKTMRDQIDNYTMDKAKAPQSLQDLVDGQYLRIIPKDPFTGSADTWQRTQTLCRVWTKPSPASPTCTAAQASPAATATPTAAGESKLPATSSQLRCSIRPIRYIRLIRALALLLPSLEAGRW